MVLLIVYYVTFMIAGDRSAYLIGLIVKREFGSQASLIRFPRTVWMTEPKRAAPAVRGYSGGNSRLKGEITGLTLDGREVQSAASAFGMHPATVSYAASSAEPPAMLTAS